MKEKETLIPRHGGYRKLKSFQVAQLVYDVTVRFCDRYIQKRSRTHDQMVQAARSGVQNIAEGSKASGTSKKTELKLTNVARASLEELRLDYEDFLRQRGLPLWERKDPRRQSLIDARCATADAVAQWCQRQRGSSRPSGPGGPGGRKQNSPRPQPDAARSASSNNANALASTSTARPASSGTGAAPAKPINSTKSTQSTKSTASTAPELSTYPEIAANAALALIAVACALLDRQLASQADAFEREGGFTERLYRVRKNARGASR